jgi:hypothetical protein
MSIPTQPLISRKDLAQLLGISSDAVRRNERRLGLHRARRNINARCVRYRTDIAWTILRDAGLV